jgi:archaeosine-15-forming tRNA-guanine transglycosylase
VSTKLLLLLELHNASVTINEDLWQCIGYGINDQYVNPGTNVRHDFVGDCSERLLLDEDEVVVVNANLGSERLVVRTLNINPGAN